jgi:hypothetical protein
MFEGETEKAKQMRIGLEKAQRQGSGSSIKKINDMKLRTPKTTTRPFTTFRIPI